MQGTTVFQGHTAAPVDGDINFKVWFEPQGKDQDQLEVAKKLKNLQMATMEARLREIEQRVAGAGQRAQKEKQRKQRQKAAKAAGRAAGKAAGERSGATAAKAETPTPMDADDAPPAEQAAPVQQQRMERAKEVVSRITAQVAQIPSHRHVPHVAELLGTKLKMTVPSGTIAAGLTSGQLSEKLASLRGDADVKSAAAALLKQAAAAPEVPQSGSIGAAPAPTPTPRPKVAKQNGAARSGSPTPQWNLFN